MKGKPQYVWAVYFVGFDDADVDPESFVEPYVGKERIKTTADATQAWMDASMAALLRGGELLAVVTDDEDQAESVRSRSEAEILRGP